VTESVEADSDGDTAGDRVIERLRAAGCVFAEDEARLLAAEAPSPVALQQLVERRVAGEPLEQVLGWAEFCGLRLAVEPGVFVPRRRTELLVRSAAARCRPGDLVVDLCCGVGAIMAGLLEHIQPLELYGSELDPTAVSCARRNLGPRATLAVGDLFDPLPDSLRGSVNLITANAPYVPTDQIAFMPSEARDHERRAALDGGPDGLELHRRIIAESASWLVSGGWLLIETGRDQADRDRTLMTDSGFTAEVIGDPEISGTVVIGHRPRTWIQADRQRPEDVSDKGLAPTDAPDDHGDRDHIPGR
jgi:release factor glutamine methyltransferase